MHCGLEQDYWDPCECLKRIGREIRSKAGQGFVRKAKVIEEQEPDEDYEGMLF
jgi:hypothetical protein